MDPVAEACGRLRPLLATLPATMTAGGLLFGAAGRLADALMSNSPEAPMRLSARRSISDLLPALSRFAAELSTAAAATCCTPTGGPASPWLAAGASGCSIVYTLLYFLEELQLSVADMQHLWRAASLPLRTQPQLMAAFARQGWGASNRSFWPPIDMMGEFYCKCCGCVVSLLKAALPTPRAAQPPALVEAAQAALQPRFFLEWLQYMEQVAAALVPHTGPAPLAPSVLGVLFKLLLPGQPAAEAMAAAPAEQQAGAVQLLASFLGPAVPAVRSEDLRWLLDCLGILTVPCLHLGRLHHEERTGAQLMGFAEQLLQQAPALLAAPAGSGGSSGSGSSGSGSSGTGDLAGSRNGSGSGSRGSRGRGDGGSSIGGSVRDTSGTIYASGVHGTTGVALLSVLQSSVAVQIAQMLAALCIDRAKSGGRAAQGGDTAMQRAEQQRASALFFRLAGSALPSLSRCFAELAAASPAGAGDAPGRQPTAACYYWGEASTDIQGLLGNLVTAIHGLNAGLCKRQVAASTSADCAAAAAAAEVLMLLAAELPQLPLPRLAAAGGSWEATVPASRLVVPPKSSCLAEIAALNPAQALGSCCLSIADALTSGMATHSMLAAAEGPALALFHTAVSACKYEWAAAGGIMLPVTTCDLSSLTALHSSCLAAVRVHLVLLQTAAEPQAAQLQRRLDCLAASYLSALQARTPHQDFSKSNEGSQQLLALASLCHNPGTSELLLASSHGVEVLLQTADTLIEGCPDNAGHCAEAALLSLGGAVSACPGLLPTLAAQHSLLRTLCRAVEPLLTRDHWQRYHDLIQVTSDLAHLLRLTVPPLRAAAWAAAGSQAGGTSRGAEMHMSPDSLSLHELPRVVAALVAKQPGAGGSPPCGSSGSASSSRAPVPLARDLVLRQAHALALRSCAHPRCANLAGASEAERKGRRCGSCRVARYCSEACSHADWKVHKAACRLVKAERQQAAGAAAGAAAATAV